MALSKITNASVADTAVHGRRNLIINGSQIVAQRGTSSTSSGKHTCDRWTVNFQAFDQLAVTQSQSTTTPSGFSNSLKVEVTTAETALAADELMYVGYRIEAQDLQHLNYGGSGAKAVTLSFWVRSSLTGKYSVLLYQDDATRSNTKSFNITSADTWEYKTITIDGDTAGTIDNNNGAGLSLYITLAAGADFSGTPHSGWGAYTATDDFSFSDNVDFTAQTGTFYITGVQLEVGDASPFEHRSYGEELAACQRYYRIFPSLDSTATYGTIGNGYAYDTDTFLLAIPLSVRMRSLPSVTSSGSLKVFTSGNPTNAITNVNTSDSSRTSLDVLYVDSDVGAATLTAREGGMVTRNNDSDAYLAFDAEL